MYHQLINQDYHVLNSYTCLTLEKKLYPNLRFRNTEREGEGGDQITYSRGCRTGTAAAPDAPLVGQGQ
jgi:hypothetical protein